MPQSISSKSKRREINWKSLRKEGLLQSINHKFEVEGRDFELEEIFFQIDKTILSIRKESAGDQHYVTAYIEDQNGHISSLLESYPSSEDQNLHFFEFGPVHHDSTKIKLVILRWNIIQTDKKTGSREMDPSRHMTIISAFDGPRAMTRKGDIEPGYRLPDDVASKLREIFGLDFVIDRPIYENEEPLLNIDIEIDRSKWKKHYYEIPINKSFTLGGLGIDFEKISGWRSGIRLHYTTSFPKPLKGTVEKRWEKCWENILEIVRKGDSREEILEKADEVCRYHPTQENTTSLSFRITTDKPLREEDKKLSYHTISPFEEWISHFLRFSLLIEYAEHVPLKEPVQVFIEPETQEIPLEFEFEGKTFEGRFKVHSVNITDNEVVIIHESIFPLVGQMEVTPAFELVDERMNRYFLTARSLPIDYESDSERKTQLVKSIYGRSPLPYVILEDIKTKPRKLVLQFKNINIHFHRPLMWNLL